MVTSARQYIEVSKDGHNFLFGFDPAHSEDAMRRAAALLVQLAEPGDELKVVIAE